MEQTKIKKHSGNPCLQGFPEYYRIRGHFYVK